MQEDKLPRNPEEGRAMPEPPPLVNRVVILETGPKPLPQPAGPRSTWNPHQPIDDDQVGPGYSG